MSGEQEDKAMHNLIKEVYGDSLRLDAGFNDRKLVKKIAEIGMKPYIFPRKDNKLNESFHSSFRTKHGIITKVRFPCKLSQVTARIILHNRRRPAYFKRVAS